MKKELSNADIMSFLDKVDKRREKLRSQTQLHKALAELDDRTTGNSGTRDYADKAFDDAKYFGITERF
ncbi:hypothetical protein [Vibrio superstes]|uniref:Uncharacterized protein n=1 Tax=Vibrio superstes NBRC 103154 TaxID=1219062 RepID=A0A511QKK6_9VIBR|nr:hypothetical protein [Vibrio superstes]GEM77829.1 hypothetical protein VSU01S_00740 [Vibrio superstes NBRC 103154]